MNDIDFKQFERSFLPFHVISITDSSTGYPKSFIFKAFSADTNSFTL